MLYLPQQTKTKNMKHERKMLQISMEYGDLQEGIKALENVVKELRKSQVNYGRESKNGCVIQWGVFHTNFPDYRIEVSNGKTCMIIPSKMNVK